LDKARESIDSGAALQTLDAWIDLTNQFVDVDNLC
jgi:hypothetical protein